MAHDALLIGGADPLATRVQMPPSRKHHALRVKPWSTEAPTAPPTSPPTSPRPPPQDLHWTGSKMLALPPKPQPLEEAAAAATHLTGPSAAFAALVASPRWAARQGDLTGC